MGGNLKHSWRRGLCLSSTSSGPGEKRIRTGAGRGRVGEGQEAEGALVYPEKFSVKCGTWG